MIVSRIPNRISSHGSEGLVLLFALVVLPLGTVSARAEVASWNRFRGPNGSGVAPACRPPVRLDASCVAWKTPVPPGLSSPVLAGNQIFLTALEDGRLVTLAFDTASGKRTWRREAPPVPVEKVHVANSPAASTPLVDDERLYVIRTGTNLLAFRTRD